MAKTGTGTLTLAGANDLRSATVSVLQGKLLVANSQALSVSQSSGVVTVSSGATLGLQGGVSIANGSSTSIRLTGAGVGGAGALENVSGVNSLSTDILLIGNTGST